MKINPRRWCHVFGFVTLGCLVLSARADDGADKANAAKVDKLFETWSKPGSPGCALGVVRNGKLIVARGYGMANLDDDVPITPKSVFEVASLTKSFTCVCLALLMDQGKLSPDDDIRKYVPEMPRYDPPITIRHLIRCENGLHDYWHLMQLAGWNIEDAWTDKDVLALVTRQKAPAFKPGSEFDYTSTGYFLLGRAVERITGLSLARFAEKNVFGPLGMKSTYLEDNPTRVVKNRVVGYDVSPDGRTRRWMMNTNVVGAMGLKTTVEDLFQWDQNFYANRLPDGPYLREFLKNGTLLGNRKVLDVWAFLAEMKSADPNEGYRGLKRMAFTGGLPGFVAAFVRFPEQKFSVICLSNDGTRIAPWTIALRIADVYLAEQMKEEKRPVIPTPQYKFVDLAKSDLLDKVGAYRMLRTRMIWEISAVEGELALTDRLGETHRWQALSPTRFRTLEGPHRGTHTLVFERRSDRRFKMRLEGDDGSKTEFEPVQFVRPDAKQLSEYAGRYYSAELNATYSFSVRDGCLFLQVNNHRWEALSPTVADEFMPQLRTPDDGRIITFVRDSKKRVTGFTIDLWRIKGVSFEKLTEGQRKRTQATEDPPTTKAGSWITFVSKRSGENLLYRMRPDGSGIQPIFGGRVKHEAVPGLSPGVALHREPHWSRQSPDGKLFLSWVTESGRRGKQYLGGYARFMIWVGRVGDARARPVGIDNENELFAWSPDSQRFAYSVQSVRRSLVQAEDFWKWAKADVTSYVLVSSTDGTEVGLPLKKAGHWGVTDWSPDGRRLLLQHTPVVGPLKDTQFELYELDLEKRDTGDTDALTRLRPERSVADCDVTHVG